LGRSGEAPTGMNSSDDLVRTAVEAKQE